MMMKNDWQSGVSLLEVMIAIGFLSVLVIPLGNIYLASFEGAGNVGYFDQAFNLTQDLMEEITSKAFEDPEAGAGSFGTEEVNRINYDDVDDYDDYVDGDGSNTPPKDVQGNDMDDYPSFTRSVTVANVTDVGLANMPRANLVPQADGSTDFKLILVTVSRWNDQQVETLETLERIVANIN